MLIKTLQLNQRNVVIIMLYERVTVNVRSDKSSGSCSCSNVSIIKYYFKSPIAKSRQCRSLEQTLN